jgi:putative two-component system response regulator
MTPSVLYIEDNDANIRLVVEMLSRLRPHVDLLVATTGEEGVQIALDTSLSLILLDVGLPGMPGQDVIRHLHTIPKAARTPVVVISAVSSADRAAEVMTLGAVDFLSKPFYTDQLLRIIDRFCGW